MTHLSSRVPLKLVLHQEPIYFPFNSNELVQIQFSYFSQTVFFYDTIHHFDWDTSSKFDCGDGRRSGKAMEWMKVKRHENESTDKFTLSSSVHSLGFAQLKWQSGLANSRSIRLINWKLWKVFPSSIANKAKVYLSDQFKLNGNRVTLFIAIRKSL